jgi:hypothetical protein
MERRLCREASEGRKVP